MNCIIRGNRSSNAGVSKRKKEKRKRLEGTPNEYFIIVYCV